jgi:2-alkenal reductase
MKLLTKYPLVYGLMLLLLVAACGQENEAPVVDTAVIAATVQAEVLTQLAEQETAVATATPPDLTALIEEEIVSQLAETAEDITAEELAEMVRTQVDLYLEQRVEPTVVANASLSSAADSDLEQSLMNVYQIANPAVVYIIVPPLGSGSGFVYSEEGYIVTNNHVVTDGTSFEIVFANGERRRAELVGADVDSDLAVLQVEDLPEGIRPLPLDNSDEVQVGQLVVAIGNPFGEQGSMSLGIISALGRSLESQRGLTGSSSYSLPQVIQTDAPINPGNSGGPLLNLDGEVIGINAAISTEIGTNSGVGYAIPVNAVQRIVPSLISDGRYAYPYMGAGFDDEISLDEQAVFGLSQTQGAYVLSVFPDGPADEAGVIAANATTGRGGDLIVALDGHSINSFADLNAYLTFNSEAGQTIEVTVLRNGQLETLFLTLGERP